MLGAVKSYENENNKKPIKVRCLFRGKSTMVTRQNGRRIAERRNKNVNIIHTVPRRKFQAMSVVRYKDVANRTYASVRLFARWCMAQIAVWAKMTATNEADWSFLDNVDDDDVSVPAALERLQHVPMSMIAAWWFLESSMKTAIEEVIAVANSTDNASSADLKVTGRDTQSGDQEEVKLIGNVLADTLFPTFDYDNNEEIIMEGMPTTRKSSRRAARRDYREAEGFMPPTNAEKMKVVHKLIS